MRSTVFVFVLACGDNHHVLDAVSPDTSTRTPNLGPLIELGDLPPRGHAPFSQGVEPSIATDGNTVVVSYVNLGDADPSTYANDGDVDKRAAVVISSNRGATFGAPLDPSITTKMYSTDPVVRTAPDGTFWMTHLGQELAAGLDEVSVGRSSDGITWQRVAGIPAFDKEWFAIDDTSIWLAYLPRSGGGYTRLSLDGSVLAQATPVSVGGASGVYVDVKGMHVTHVSDSNLVPLVLWNGADAPALEGAPLPSGNTEMKAAPAYTTTVSLGATPDGGQWIVRTVKRGESPAIMLRIRHLPGDDGIDLPISDPEAHAFMPAAIVDDDGRLRVVYYDTSGSAGVLRTTRSLDIDWTRGFEPSTIIDPDACPGDRWMPTFVPGNNEGGERRLREYIDIATTPRRVHVAFTHSPQSPSRAVATYFDY